MSTDYFSFTTPNGIKGGLDPKKMPNDQGVLLHFEVEFIQTVLARAQKLFLQITIVQPMHCISKEFGYSVIMTDPSGNHIGLWSQKGA